MLRAQILSCLLPLVWSCGGGPSPGPELARLDVFHDVYLRGGPAPQGAPARVALTFDALTPCTADLLARLRSPGEGLSPVLATFFVDRASLELAAGEDPVALRALLARLVAEGHGLALRVVELPQRWRLDSAAFRQGLAEEARAVRRLLARHGFERGGLRVWRPPAADLDLLHLGQVAAADRPAVLWSRFVQADHPERMVGHLAGRLADGDIVALPGAGAGCPAVAAVPLLAEALQAAELEAVSVPVLLGRALARHEPLRLVRYHGQGLAAACHEPLGVPLRGPDDGQAPRWALVHDERPDGTVVALPLPGLARSARAFLEDGLSTARRLWSERAAWRGRPGCLREVSPHRLGPPVTAEARDGPKGHARWWVVGRGGVEERDFRALTAGSLPVVLPTLADLVRLEAVQRLPWRLRGLVAGALGRLGLQVPLLVEARATTGLVVGAALDTAAVKGPRAVLRQAIAGYVQLVEVSLAEYLYLARRSPSDRKILFRVARGADGFVRAGPFWTLPAVAGGAPDPARSGPNGRASFTEPPEALLVRVLQAGVRLRPGDVVAAAPRPVIGPPSLARPVEGASFRGEARQGLARSIFVGMTRDAYLRPGGVLRFDGDLLGRQTLRVAAPPGVDLPSLGRDAGEEGS